MSLNVTVVDGIETRHFWKLLETVYGHGEWLLCYERMYSRWETGALCCHLCRWPENQNLIPTAATPPSADGACETNDASQAVENKLAQLSNPDLFSSETAWFGEGNDSLHILEEWVV